MTAGPSNAGAAYTFFRTDSGWIQEQKLTANSPFLGANLGHSVSLAGSRIALGAPFLSGSSGAAYVYSFDGSTWQQQAFLLASDNNTNDRNGWSVSISGNYVLTGAPGDDSGGQNTGAAYVFKNDSQQGWIEQKKLKASDAEPSDQFGFSVYLSGYWGAVGAISEDEAGFSAGAGYIFNRTTCDIWNERDKIISATPNPSGSFGFSMQLDVRYESQGWPNFLTAFLTVLSGAPGNAGGGAAYWHENEIPAYVRTCQDRKS